MHRIDVTRQGARRRVLPEVPSERSHHNPNFPVRTNELRENRARFRLGDRVVLADPHHTSPYLGRVVGFAGATAVDVQWPHDVQQHPEVDLVNATPGPRNEWAFTGSSGAGGAIDVTGPGHRSGGRRRAPRVAVQPVYRNAPGVVAPAPTQGSTVPVTQAATTSHAPGEHGPVNPFLNPQVQKGLMAAGMPSQHLYRLSQVYPRLVQQWQAQGASGTAHQSGSGVFSPVAPGSGSGPTQLRDPLRMPVSPDPYLGSDEDIDVTMAPAYQPLPSLGSDDDFPAYESRTHIPARGRAGGRRADFFA
jgi:hypothetical protein